MIHWAAQRLCPYLTSGHAWAWDLWAALSKHCDLHSAFRRTLADVYGDQLSSGNPILAEATLLGLSPVRGAFHSALVDLLPGGIEGRIFWLHPTASELVDRFNGRIDRGERKGGKIDVEQARKDLSFYELQMMGCNPLCTGDSSEMEEKRREFLGPV